ncbi:MAG: hypothetical protein HY934_06750, partial [Candidatus Firestonebacteria bacterium]|nr:hypothetical protein [Candidatus Firestonebacteria bacterium]
EDYFNFFGGNPIYILKDKIVKINLSISKKISVKDKKIPAENSNKSGIKGKIVFKDEPLKDAYAFVYQNADSNLKGPVFSLAEPSALDGSFTIEIPPGSYYLLAKKKLLKRVSKRRVPPPEINGEEVLVQFMYIEEFAGPLESGDYYYFYDENPIKVEKGFYSNVILNCVKKIGNSENGFNKLSDTRIEGVILDKNGNPVEGVYAFAHKGVQISLDLPNPKYVSNKTKEDGKFILNLDGNGLYYIGAKKILGRTPQFGDLYGYYVSKDKDNAIAIKNGEVIKDMVITVSPIE